MKSCITYGHVQIQVPYVKRSVKCLVRALSGAQLCKNFLHTDLSSFPWEGKKKVSPNVGLEPTTPRLRVSCSTD